ncbi:hypothetical protein [Aureibacter tunicatorum]|uniref:DUF4374 domain-containing protein n=1 Tax=Aureibacter tunicatorum TaxID=866807 RepID=A0AAE3XMA2_9BACT|nr:hypothetical protein [Aureibacter tunicatorum]MDR6240516.1 hypothetical protein [Aureibacter tunicatorum]BDD06623.1 hypothetical protein AUTU_41060 [Aureibacter tunicatorum]
MRIFSKKHIYFSIIAMAMMAVSCNDNVNEGSGGGDDPEYAENSFTLASEIEAGGQTQNYIDHIDDLTEGEHTFINNGLQVPGERAARVIGHDGYVYSLNYGTGLISQYRPLEAGGYQLIKELNGGAAVGTEYPRYKIVSDDNMMIYNVDVEYVYEDEENQIIKDVIPTMSVATIRIPDLVVTDQHSFVIPTTEESKAQKAYPTRVDAPIASNGKVYFGLMRYEDGNSDKDRVKGLETLVLDYPSLENPTVDYSDVADGHTNGYRTPSMYLAEDGFVYQSNQFMSGFGFDLSQGSKTVITRLSNSVYDDSYVFNVTQALGEEVSTAGWFYVGNGIGYMPICMEDMAGGENNNIWSVAKIDINNKTAVKMNVPLSYLQNYQSGVVDEGKFYMAISPIGGEAHIYEFDPTSDSPDAFKKTVKLDGGNVYIQGIYQ